MKIREGFISNSSSSSFIIVGVADDPTMEHIAEKDGKFVDGEYQNINCDYGIDNSCPLSYYGCWDELYYIGMDISEKLEEKTLPELRKELQQKLKEEYQLDVPLEKINLYYGEIGEG